MHTQQDNPFGILMYHRITPVVAGIAAPTWNVEPERFRRQLEGLLSRGYQAWPLRRVLACRQANEPIPARVFVVTFDDGYENVYHNAWPILKALSVPATVFVVTSYLDADRPLASDDWTAAGSKHVPTTAWKPLSTVQCAEMMEHGLVEVGSHTHTHADFRGHPEAFRSDLACSLKALRGSLGVEQASFAFPFGYCEVELTTAARELGVRCALTTEPKPVSRQADPFAWGRLTVARYDTAATLVLKLNGWYAIVRGVWHCLRRPWRTGLAMFGPCGMSVCNQAEIGASHGAK